MPTIAVNGLGYVGLPLAVGVASRYPVTGFDTKPPRIAELRAGQDSTLEVPDAELAAATNPLFTSDPADLAPASVFIVTVPTPIDDAKQPDLTPLRDASATVGQALSNPATPSSTSRPSTPVAPKKSASPSSKRNPA